MSKIGVALALCVLLLGAVLVIGNGVAEQAIDRGENIGSSLSDTNLRVNATSGEATILTP